MTMPGWLTLNLYVLFIDVMLLAFSLKKRVRSAQDRTFSHLLLVVLFLLVVDSFSRLTPELVPNMPRWIEKAGTYLTFAGDPVGYYFSIAYIDSWIAPSTSDKDLHLRRFFLAIVMGYAALNFVLVTASQLAGLGWFYSFPADVYTRGPLYVPRGCINMAMCLFVGLYVLMRRKDIRASYRAYILLFPLIVLVSGLMQVAIGGAAWEYAGTIFAALLLYLYVQDHNMDVDHLTGLLNRRGIDRELNARKIQDDRTHAFAAVMIDLDYFKAINDTYGHEAGDEALRTMSGFLTRAFSGKYYVGRYGGDEFLVLSACVAAVTTGVRICRDQTASCIAELRRLCDEFDASGSEPWRLEFSAGFDIFDPSSQDMSVDAFIAHIDELMYEEKERRHAARNLPAARQGARGRVSD